MNVTLDSTGTRLRLHFDSAEALSSFAGDWLANEGCLVRLSEALRLWTELTVELRHKSVSPVAVEAKVVQVFGGGGGGFATALQATEPEGLEALTSSQAETERPSSAETPRPGVGTSETLGASPAFRIREMNVAQKMRLASRASLTERQILLRDSSPQVLMGLLANPRIEDKEVLVLAKSSAASSGVLQRIAKDRRWSTNYEVRLALVKNPQTPTPLALHMLEALRERDLRVLAKGSNVREAIRSAAVRKVVKHR